MSDNDNELEKQYNECITKAKQITNGQKSLPYSLKALEYAVALKDEFKTGVSYNEISFDYERLGNLSQALHYVFMASQKFEKSSYGEGLGIVYNRIGCLYSIQKNKNLAIFYLRKAILYHKKSSGYLLANDLNNIGEIYRVNGNYLLALKNFQAAFNISWALKDSGDFAYHAGNIGLAYAGLNMIDSADYYLKLSTDILMKNGDFYPITEYMIENARILFKQGKTDEAIKKAKQAKILSKKENFREQLRDVNKLMTDLYLEKHDFKNAFNSLTEYNIHKDSLNNSIVVSEMAEMRADFEVSKKEVQIKTLEAVNTLRNKVNWGLGSGFLLVTVLTVFLIRINKQRKQSNQLLLLKKEELEEKNAIINASLTEKETLLKEIHHRVKNNLQIISSLLSLQSQSVKNKKALEAFSESQRRLHSIALVHQKLYQNENLSKININEYLGDLVETIHQSFFSGTKNIRYELNIAEISLDVDTAVPLGLIVNELVTNAYKYAFNKMNEGRISIGLNKNSSNLYNLNVKDNGQGLPENFDFNATESLGLKLVSILSRQLKGKLEMTSNQGAGFSLEFEDIIQSKT